MASPANSGNLNFESPDNLKLLFYNSPIVKIEISDQKSHSNTIPDVIMTPIKSTQHILPKLTPMSKLIYDAVSTPEREQLLKDLQMDDIAIDSSNEDINDDDYKEKWENSKLGFYMENWVAYHLICPVCKKHSLKKYYHTNIPVVDLICDNYNADEHNNILSCKLFQVKIQLGDTYFSKKYKFISIGSVNKGYNAHVISPAFLSNHKKIIIGYICLTLNELQPNKMYKIDNNKSFVLLPNLQVDHTNQFYTTQYYKYISSQTKFNKPTITWNDNLVQTLEISEIFKPRIIDSNTDNKNTVNNNTILVDTNTIFIETLIPNPFTISKIQPIKFNLDGSGNIDNSDINASGYETDNEDEDNVIKHKINRKHINIYKLVK